MSWPIALCLTLMALCLALGVLIADRFAGLVVRRVKPADKLGDDDAQSAGA